MQTEDNWRHSCSVEHITHQHACDCYYLL